MEKERRVFQGINKKNPEGLKNLPSTPPPWRDFKNRKNKIEQGRKYIASEREIEMVNAALYLRRPLLIEGSPGVGKSSIAYAVAYELDLGEVLLWPITSKSNRNEGLYSYDALARLQDAALLEKKQLNPLVTKKKQTELPDIGQYITLGPLGTAFLKSKPNKPSVLLIDEIDKSDIDFPNDLLHLFEEGEFEIREISRIAWKEKKVMIDAHHSHEKLNITRDGIVRCEAFPLVFMTSNGEREFPPAFLRRCLRLRIEQPNEDKLKDIVAQHLDMKISSQDDSLISPKQSEAEKVLKDFLKIRDNEHREVATDQLLNAVYLILQEINLSDRESLRKAILSALSGV